MFYQARNDLQNKYYETWRLAGQKGNVLKTLTGSTPLGNHYEDCYLRMTDIHRHLHPYQFISKEDIVIACGCHDGKVQIGTSQPLILSTLAKKVIVLEPDPVNINVLKNYILKHSIDNIEIVPKAVWHTETTVVFTVCKRTESNQIGKVGSRGKQIEVPTTTLDLLATEYGDIDFVNLTINGTEFEALLGAQDMLKNNTNISIAMITKRHPMFKSRMKAIDLLENNGYYIGCADGPPRAWNVKDFYFSVGTKDKELLKKLSFKEGEIPW